MKGHKTRLVLVTPDARWELRTTVDRAASAGAAKRSGVLSGQTVM